jgi:hypothetical protein
VGGNPRRIDGGFLDNTNWNKHGYGYSMRSASVSPLAFWYKYVE